MVPSDRTSSGSEHRTREEFEMAHHYRNGCCGPSRRTLLAGLAAAVATTLLPGRGSLAQPAPPGRHLIDTHHHYYPVEIINGWQDYLTRHGGGQLTPKVAHWTPKTSLDEMDNSGVATAILSLASIPGVWFGLDVPGMRHMSRLCNEYAAKMVRDYPGRYG